MMAFVIASLALRELFMAVSAISSKVALVSKATQLPKPKSQEFAQVLHEAKQMKETTGSITSPVQHVMASMVKSENRLMAIKRRR